MSSEKAANNTEIARHSRANSRTSITSLGDVTAMPDGNPANSSSGNAGAGKGHTSSQPIERNSGRQAGKQQQQPEHIWD